MDTQTSISPFSYTTTDSFRYEDSSLYTPSTGRTTISTTESTTPEPNVNVSAYSCAYSEICFATKNFLLKPLSSSSSSKTWRCSIRKRDVVVIQRKLRRSVEMSQIEDTLSTICKDSHFSVIKLLGASISGDLIFLVYDYVSGVNLADCLRNPKNPNLTVLSSWYSRLQIANEIARGLEHIHHYAESETSIVHNHLKSTSVIVTEPYFNPKICHFGTAELVGEISGELISGYYMAPELITGGTPSQKSDVFAFGVLLLEILSGDEPAKVIYDEESGFYRRILLIDSAREAIESTDKTKIGQWIDKTKIRQWIDKRIVDWYTDEVEKMIRVGLECVHVEPDKRPDMRCVASKIGKVFFSKAKAFRRLDFSF